MRVLKKLSVPALLACLAVSLGACQQPAPSSYSRLSTGDTAFISQAVAGGIAEVRISELAETRSSNRNIQAFARRMIEDHTAANRELLAIAARNYQTPPTDPDGATLAQIQQLALAQGAQFDRQFTLLQVQAHERQLALFRNQATVGGDAALRDFAVRQVPVLQMHLEMARQLDSSLQR